MAAKRRDAVALAAAGGGVVAANDIVYPPREQEESPKSARRRLRRWSFASTRSSTLVCTSVVSMSFSVMRARQNYPYRWSRGVRGRTPA